MGSTEFPYPAKLAWEVDKTASFKTLIQEQAVPGMETRISFGPDPIYKFTLQWKALFDSDPIDSLNILEGFFLARRGAYESFLIDLGRLTKNPANSGRSGQGLKLDANGNAPLVRTLGASRYDEAIYELSGTPVIYADGDALVVDTDYQLVAPDDAYTLNASNINYSGYTVKFLTSQAGKTITADFGFLYRVRFQEDALEVSQFLYLLWEAKQVNLIGTRS